MTIASAYQTGPRIDARLLCRVPLFSNLSEAQLQEVAALVMTRYFGKRECIVSEGDTGSALYFIMTGSAIVARSLPDGREAILSILTNHDFFGEMSVLSESRCSATVRAKTNVILGVIRRDAFLALIDREPKLGRALIVGLSERLRATNRLVTATTSQDVRLRLASLLLTLSETFGESVEGGTRISLRLTNQEIANMIGATRETVNRTLNRLWDERLIDMRSSRIVVTDVAELDRVVKLMS